MMGTKNPDYTELKGFFSSETPSGLDRKLLAAYQEEIVSGLSGPIHGKKGDLFYYTTDFMEDGRLDDTVLVVELRGRGHRSVAFVDYHRCLLECYFGDREGNIIKSYAHKIPKLRFIHDCYLPGGNIEVTREFRYLFYALGDLLPSRYGPFDIRYGPFDMDECLAETGIANDMPCIPGRPLDEALEAASWMHGILIDLAGKHHGDDPLKDSKGWLPIDKILEGICADIVSYTDEQLDELAHEKRRLELILGEEVKRFSSSSGNIDRTLNDGMPIVWVSAYPVGTEASTWRITEYRTSEKNYRDMAKLSGSIAGLICMLSMQSSHPELKEYQRRLTDAAELYAGMAGIADRIASELQKRREIYGAFARRLQQKSLA